jgi:cytochrome P450/NADPH-cytochrome P450 reductase
MMNLYGLHHDPVIWGNDANIFRPERFLDGGWERLPKNSWKAFGDGMRACIGRAFAEQEMILVVALILQNFQVELADPSYNLRKFPQDLETRTTKIVLTVHRRQGHSYEKARRTCAQGTQETRSDYG